MLRVMQHSWGLAVNRRYKQYSWSILRVMQHSRGLSVNKRYKQYSWRMLRVMQHSRGLAVNKQYKQGCPGLMYRNPALGQAKQYWWDLASMTMWSSNGGVKVRYSVHLRATIQYSHDMVLMTQYIGFCLMKEYCAEAVYMKQYSWDISCGMQNHRILGGNRM